MERKNGAPETARGLPQPLLGPQNFFRLRRTKNITQILEIDINWNGLPWPLLEPQIFFRLQQAKKMTRFQEICINWNRLPRLYYVLNFFPACG